MEEQIVKVVRNLKSSYILFWLCPIIILIAGEMEWFPVGLWADDVQIVYCLEALSILITAIFIPLSLKLFSLVLTKKIDKLGIILALKRYQQWSFVRLGVLELNVIFSLFVYYSTLSSTGNLCMLISLTASFFCFPSEKKLRAELRINKE